MRLFTAIMLPEEVCAALKPCFRDWSDQYGLTFVDTDSLHLTVYWIGAQTENTAKEIVRVLQEIRHNTFALNLNGVGSFPGSDNKPPFVLWAAIGKGRTQLRSLHDEIATRRGWVPPTYRPHVTICKPTREQEPQARTFLNSARLATAAGTVRSFGLYESLGGGDYRLVESFPLHEQLSLF